FFFCVYIILCFIYICDHRRLHSFPTRRSSDLEGLEADDLLGTISHMCEEKGMDVSIISGDRDTLQLATEHVKIRIPKTKQGRTEDRKSTRLNSSHVSISYAVFCLKKK